MPVRRPRHSGHRLCRLNPDRRIRLSPRHPCRQARAVLRRRKEPYGDPARCRHGPGSRCFNRRGLRFGRRTLHGGLSRGPGRRETGECPDAASHPACRSPENRPVDRHERRFRPAGHGSPRRQGPQLHRPWHRRGCRSHCRWPRLHNAGIRKRLLIWAAVSSTMSPRTCGYTRKKSLARSSRSCGRATTRRRLPSANDHEFGNGVAVFTRDGDAARDFCSRVQIGMVGVNVPIPVPLAYYTFGGWKRSGFGDLNQHGPDSIKFYTRTKTITSRWPSGVREGAEFVIPTMK